jgi:HK97 gp10 family phage protein
MNGLGDLLKKFERLSGEGVLSILDRSVEKGAAFLTEEVKQRVPIKTGTLRESIGYEKDEKKSSEKKIIYKIGLTSKDAYYGVFLEFGTGKRIFKHPHIFKGWDGKWHSAKTSGVLPKKPFLRPAFDENIEKINQIIDDSFIEELKKW